MSLTRDDYENALADFIQHIGRLDENGVSALLYGSMARGDIIPGHSDLDFWVFLKKEAFQDLERFRHAYDVMVAAGKTLVAGGLPVIHAFCYYGEHELALLPQALVPNLQSERSSRVVWGQDVRTQMDSTPASRMLYQTSYFVEMREQVFLPLTSLLVKRSLTQSDLQRIVGSLKYIKYVPEAACAALDLWPGEIDAVALLAAQFPQINIALVAEVEAFRTGSNPTADPQKVQQMLQQSLRFVEQLNETLWNKA